MSEDKKTGAAPTGIAEENLDSIESDTGIQTVLEKLSKEKPNQVTEIMAMMGVGPMSNPLHQKMNEEHITQVLELAAKHDEREYNLHKDSQSDRANENTANRRYTFATFVMLVLLIVVVLILFKSNPDTLIPVLTGIGGLVGGFLGGWGFGRSRPDHTST